MGTFRYISEGTRNFFLVSVKKIAFPHTNTQTNSHYKEIGKKNKKQIGVVILFCYIPFKSAN